MAKNARCESFDSASFNPDDRHQLVIVMIVFLKKIPEFLHSFITVPTLIEQIQLVSGVELKLISDDTVKQLI